VRLATITPLIIRNDPTTRALIRNNFHETKQIYSHRRNRCSASDKNWTHSRTIPIHYRRASASHPAEPIPPSPPVYKWNHTNVPLVDQRRQVLAVPPFINLARKEEGHFPPNRYWHPFRNAECDEKSIPHAFFFSFCHVYTSIFWIARWFPCM